MKDPNASSENSETPLKFDHEYRAPTPDIREAQSRCGAEKLHPYLHRSSGQPLVLVMQTPSIYDVSACE